MIQFEELIREFGNVAVANASFGERSHIDFKAAKLFSTNHRSSLMCQVRSWGLPGGCASAAFLSRSRVLMGVYGCRPMSTCPWVSCLALSTSMLTADMLTEPSAPVQISNQLRRVDGVCQALEDVHEKQRPRP